MLLIVSASAATSPFALTVRFCSRSPFGDRGDDFDDAAHLLGEVGGHDVHVVGEVLPRAGDAGHLRLSAEQAFRADLARHARHFRGEGVELIDHRVDGVLQLENLALDVDRDLARQVAARDGRRDFRDVADLRRQVGGEQVDVVGEVLPRAADAGHDRLTAEAAVGADLARDARHFRGEGAQLLHHRVERFLQQEDLAAHVDRDLLGEVAAGDRDGDLVDVAHLRGEVAGHEVDVVGQVLPRTGDAGHLRLATQLSFRADLARHARDFRGERVELVDHRVDGVLELENLALHVDRDLAGEVAARDGRGDVRDVADLRREVVGHRVDAVGQVLPRAGHAEHVRLATEPAFGSDLARHARDFAGERVELVDHRVDGVFDLQNLAADVHGDLLAQVALGDGVATLDTSRSCTVRLPAMALTESVRSFHVPATPATCA